MSVNCPACPGTWLYGFTFAHRLDCPVLAAEDATQAADADRMPSRWGKTTRPATVAEILLAGVFGTPTPEAGGVIVTEVHYTTNSVRHRVVGGIDPDQKGPQAA